MAARLRKGSRCCGPPFGLPCRGQGSLPPVVPEQASSKYAGQKPQAHTHASPGGTALRRAHLPMSGRNSSNHRKKQPKNFQRLDLSPVERSESAFRIPEKKRSGKNAAGFFQPSERNLRFFPTPGNISSNLRNAEPKFFQPSDGILPDLGQLAGFFPKPVKKSSDPWNAARACGPGWAPALRGAV